MRAFVFQKSGVPLAVQDVDDSSPAAGYVVVAVKRRGTCDTDPLAIVKLGASHPCTSTVGFRDSPQAFENPRIPTAHCKIMLDLIATQTVA
tara:strand:- start:2200 stop:2472 length:273 start_codon:yes stop_codon:yes gene_type:complete